MAACYPPADQVEISVLDIMKTNGVDVKGVTLNHDGGNKYSGSALIREKGIFGTKDVSLRSHGRSGKKFFFTNHQICTLERKEVMASIQR